MTWLERPHLSPRATIKTLLAKARTAANLGKGTRKGMPLLYTKEPVKSAERVVYHQSSSGKRHVKHTIQPGMSFASKV